MNINLFSLNLKKTFKLKLNISFLLNYIFKFKYF